MRCDDKDDSIPSPYNSKVWDFDDLFKWSLLIHRRYLWCAQIDLCWWLGRLQGWSRKLWKHLGTLSQRSHFITRHSQEVNNTGCFFHIFITDRSPSRKLNLDSLSDELCKHLLHFPLSKTAKLTYFYRDHVKEHQAIIVRGSKVSICLHDLFFHWLHAELHGC